MKKHIILVFIVLFWAAPAMAQQAGGSRESEPQEQVFSGLIGPTYYWVSLDRSTRAGEYEFLEKSVGGVLQTEWDPLPHRFSLDTNYLNRKDYFGEMDYAYRDVVVVDLLTRGVFHNLDHLSLGVDDPTTPSPSFVDLNPADQYGVESQLRKAFIRFKYPDFPFHVYAEAITTDREGKIQQIFLRGFTGGLDKVSQTREIDWNSQEVRVGVNSHLGPVEADYSHAEKKFKSVSDKALFDSYPLFTVPHNEVPDLKSSSDTVKLHTSYTGKIVAAATYSSGVKKNEDSSAKTDFKNAAGDLTITPVPGLLLVFKYRHYDLSQSDPDTVTLPGIGSVFNVRVPISSTRDVMSGAVRYRVTDRMTVRGEYAVALSVRDVVHGADFNPLQIAPTPMGTGPNEWDVAHRTLQSTEKLGISYRVTNKLSLRADVAASQVTDPAYAAEVRGLLDGGLGSAPCDDELVPMKKKTVVDQGRLAMFLYNAYTAKKDGTESTGNGVRSGFKGIPSVGVTNHDEADGLPVAARRRPPRRVQNARHGVQSHRRGGGHGQGLVPGVGAA